MFPVTWDGQTGGSTRRDSGYLVEGDDLSRKVCTRRRGWRGWAHDQLVKIAGQAREGHGENLLKDVRVMLKNPPRNPPRERATPSGHPYLQHIFPFFYVGVHLSTHKEDIYLLTK